MDQAPARTSASRRLSVRGCIISAVQTSLVGSVASNRRLRRRGRDVAIRVLRLPAVFGLLLVSARLCEQGLERFDRVRGGRSPGFTSGPVTKRKADDTFIALAFSGGGTRSAAFAYGVLEELRDTTVMAHGRHRRLLDEVDVTTSVPGGSAPISRPSGSVRTFSKKRCFRTCFRGRDFLLSSTPAILIPG